MSDGFVGVATDGPGKKVDVSELAGTPGTVERQRVALGDGTIYDNLAQVDSSGNLHTATPDGANVALGSLGDASSGNSAIALLKALKGLLAGVIATSRTWTLSSGTDSVNVGNFPGTQAVSGTVTSNDGGTAITGQSLQAGGGGVLGWLSQIYKAVSGTLATSRTWTLANTTDSVNVGNFPATQPISGAVTNSNLDVALSTRLKPADTLAAVTTLGTITNPLPAGTNTIGVVGQKAQTSLTATLASAVTTVTSTASQSLDGYDGAGTLQITAVGTVAAQAVSLQIEGSVDNTNWERIAIAQIGATDSPVYSTANFTLTPGNGTISHLYAVRDTVKFIRVTTTANTLGTGLTVSCYTNPV